MSDPIIITFPIAGMSRAKAVEGAIACADATGLPAQFMFGGVTVTVRKDSDAERILAALTTAIEQGDHTPIPPYPPTQ